MQCIPKPVAKVETKTPGKMKKVIYRRYDEVDVLQLAEVDQPAISEGKVLVKVKAVSINPLDWKIVKGELKPMTGFKFPKGVGIDFSGSVERVGSGVQRFKIADQVFGLVDVFKGGALAEYILVREDQIALKPSSISFEQAAALPVTGSAALQILDKIISVGKGSEVLINGATGGIGMFATQIAKSNGAIVTAVVSPGGIELAKKWGADVVVDYTSANILQQNSRYDAVIDLSERLPFEKAKMLMKSRSIYVNTLPEPMAIIKSFINNLFAGKRFKILFLRPSREYLTELAQRASAGMEIVIDRIYPMTAVKEAYRDVSRSKIIGKVVFSVP